MERVRVSTPNKKEQKETVVCECICACESVWYLYAIWIKEFGFCPYWSKFEVCPKWHTLVSSFTSPWYHISDTDGQSRTLREPMAPLRRMWPGMGLERMRLIWNLTEPPAESITRWQRLVSCAESGNKASWLPASYWILPNWRGPAEGWAAAPFISFSSSQFINVFICMVY